MCGVYLRNTKSLDSREQFCIPSKSIRGTDHFNYGYQLITAYIKCKKKRHLFNQIILNHKHWTTLKK